MASIFSFRPPNPKRISPCIRSHPWNIYLFATKCPAIILSLYRIGWWWCDGRFLFSSKVETSFHCWALLKKFHNFCSVCKHTDWHHRRSWPKNRAFMGTKGLFQPQHGIETTLILISTVVKQHQKGRRHHLFLPQKSLGCHTWIIFLLVSVLLFSIKQ